MNLGNRMAGRRVGALCLALLCTLPMHSLPAAEDGAALAAMRAKRQELLARRRRVWFNHDGCDAASFPAARLKGRKATPQDLLDLRTTPLADTQVDTLSYCTISSGFGNFTHRTAVGHVFTAPSGSETGANITQDLIDQGTDPLEVMVSFCHREGMECFWSMRMNDTHDAAWRPKTGHRLFPLLKQEHPEYLVGSYDKKPRFGTWTSVDYARPEIRELCYRFFEEVCQKYDVDGVEMDFFRHLCYFRSVAEGGEASQQELDMMTGLLRRIREMTEREAIRRNRPILVAVRVPDSVEYARGLGLDVERWLADGLVDCLIGSGYFRLNHWSYLVELGHRHGVKVYPCLSESRIRRVPDAYRARQSDASYRARAMNAWQAGADGIYIFNEYHAERGYLHDIGDPVGMLQQPKLYFATVRNSSPGRYLASGDRYQTRPLLSPENPLPLSPDKPARMAVEVGEDWSATLRNGVEREVVCQLDVEGIGPDDRLRVTLNGNELAGGRLHKGRLAYPVDPGWMKSGVNTVEVASLADDAAGDDGAPRPGEAWHAVYAGDAVMKMPTQLPWRRLFENRSWQEETRDGALFLADRGTGKDEWANLVYPWSAVPGRLAVAEAEAKVVSSSAPLGVCMRVSNGSAVEYLALLPNRIGLRFADLWQPLDTTSAFHTYRVAVRGDDVRVYVDGQLALDGRGTFTTSAADRTHWLPFSYGKEGWNLDCFVFGSASGPGTGEALWRNIRLQDNAKVWTDLSFSVSYPAPAPEVSRWDVVWDGQSVPSKPWTRDRKNPATRAEMVDGSLRVADNGTEPGSYLHFRYPWGVQPNQGATVEARMRQVSGWSAIRCDDGVHTQRLEIGEHGIRLVYAPNQSYAMDTGDGFHTYRVVTRGEDIKVYVDGKLRIDGTGTYTKPSEPKLNNVGFGAANSPSMGEGLWDYVRIARRSH